MNHFFRRPSGAQEIGTSREGLLGESLGGEWVSRSDQERKGQAFGCAAGRVGVAESNATKVSVTRADDMPVSPPLLWVCWLAF